MRQIVIKMGKMEFRKLINYIQRKKYKWYAAINLYACGYYSPSKCYMQMQYYNESIHIKKYAHFINNTHM